MASDTPLTTPCNQVSQVVDLFCQSHQQPIAKVESGTWPMPLGLAVCGAPPGRPSVLCEESLARLPGRRVAQGPWSSEMTGHKT